MGIRQIVVSDISGSEIGEDQHARVVVKHPDYRTPLEIDASIEETEKLVDTTLRLIEFTIYAPNQAPRTALVDSRVVDKLIPNLDDVLQGAREATRSASPTRTRRASSGSSGRSDKAEKLDYTSPDNAGKLHRGRVNEVEAAWVRANQALASQNRERQTGQPIDWNDPKERARYGIS